MATAKKTPAKKVVAKKAAPKKQAASLLTKPTMTKAPAQEKFAMPREVADWIERANSTINHLRGQVERLKEENAQLKAYRRFAESRILKADYE